MFKENSIKTKGLLKKVLSILCVMFTILSLFSYLNFKPMNSNAATYDTYYCGIAGGSTNYYNRNVSKATTSQSWLSASCNGWGSYVVNVAAADTVLNNTQRVGYVYFSDSKGTLLHRIIVYQTTPYIYISTPNVTIENKKDGFGTVEVRSNISFYYSVTDDTNGRLSDTQGAFPTSTENMRYYQIKIHTREVNRSGSPWSFTFRVRTAKYNNVTRDCKLVQYSTQTSTPTEPPQPKKYRYSGRYMNWTLEFTGEQPFFKDKIYKYDVTDFDMPASNLTVDNKELYNCAKLYGIQIKDGKLEVKLNNVWTSYAKVEMLKTGDLIIRPYGYEADFNCSKEEVK